MATTLQPLFIVRRDRPDLYERLRAHFGETSQVILDRRNGDRRNGDRRRASTRATADRRWKDRREPVSRTELASWENAGHYVIFDFEEPAEPPGVAFKATDTRRIMAQPVMAEPSAPRTLWGGGGRVDLARRRIHDDPVPLARRPGSRVKGRRSRRTPTPGS